MRENAGLVRCVNDIRAIALDRLQQIQKLQNNMDENNEA